MKNKEFKELDNEALFKIDGGDSFNMVESMQNLSSQFVGWLEGIFK